MAVSSGPSKHTCGVHPSEREAPRANASIASRRLVRPRRSLTTVAVELADRLTEPCPQVQVHQAPTQPLEDHPGSEQLLDDSFVQIHGDGFAFLEQPVCFRGPWTGLRCGPIRDIAHHGHEPAVCSRADNPPQGRLDPDLGAVAAAQRPGDLMQVPGGFDHLVQEPVQAGLGVLRRQMQRRHGGQLRARKAALVLSTLVDVHEASTGGREDVDAFAGRIEQHANGVAGQRQRAPATRAIESGAHRVGGTALANVSAAHRSPRGTNIVHRRGPERPHQP